MTDGRLRVYVIGEDEAHRALAMALTDAVVERTIVERGADWLEVRGTCRWSALSERDGVEEHRRFARLKGEPPLRVRLHTRIAGMPAEPAAHQLRSWLVAHAQHHPERDALVVLLQDSDGDDRVSHGAAQVRAWAAVESAALPAFAIGVCRRDAEAWFMAVRLLVTEEPRLAAATKHLGFDPSREPERLTARPNHAVTDAKRVVRFVFLGEGERLSEGVPTSASPPHEACDALALRLAEDLDRASVFEGCGLGDFVRQLRAAVPVALGPRLPAALRA